MTPEDMQSAEEEPDSHLTTQGDDTYDVYRLIEHAESLPVETVSIHLLNDNKQNICWDDDQKQMISPSVVLEAIGSSRPVDWDILIRTHPNLTEHLQKVRDANLQYPLLVFGEKELLDGMHRLVRAWIDGVDSIKIKRFTAMPADAKIAA
jgi:hypothetical protein